MEYGTCMSSRRYLPPKHKLHVVCNRLLTLVQRFPRGFDQNLIVLFTIAAHHLPPPLPKVKLTTVLLRPATFGVAWSIRPPSGPIDVRVENPC